MHYRHLWHALAATLVVMAILQIRATSYSQSRGRLTFEAESVNERADALLDRHVAARLPPKSESKRSFPSRNLVNYLKARNELVTDIQTLREAGLGEKHPALLLRKTAQESLEAAFREFGSDGFALQSRMQLLHEEFLREIESYREAAKAHYKARRQASLRLKATVGN